MIIDLGNHTIECDFDPRIQCNNSADKVLIEDIGLVIVILKNVMSF